MEDYINLLTLNEDAQCSVPRYFRSPIVISSLDGGAPSFRSSAARSVHVLVSR